MQSEYKEEEIWRKDIRSFFCSIGKHWGWWISTTLGCSIVAIYQGGGGMIPSWLLWLVGISGIVVASFLSWKGERRNKEAAIQEKEDIERNLSEKLSQLSEEKDDEIILLKATRDAYLIFRKCVDFLRAGIYPFEALQKAELCLLPNDAIVEICKGLKDLEHGNPFDKIPMFPPDKYQWVLNAMTFGPITVKDDKSLLEFLDYIQRPKLTPPSS